MSHSGKKDASSVLSQASIELRRDFVRNPDNNVDGGTGRKGTRHRESHDSEK